MEKLSKTLTIKYALLQSAFWLCQCAIQGFAAVYLQAKDFNNTLIGVVISVGSICSIFLQPTIGGFADKTVKFTLRQICLALMLIVFVLGILLYILPNTSYIIAIIYIIILAIQITICSLLNSLVMEYANKGIPVNYGLCRGIGSICYAVISFMLGYTVDYFGGESILTAFLICYVLLLVFTWKFSITIPDNPSKMLKPSLDKSLISSKDKPLNSSNDQALNSNNPIVSPNDEPVGILQFFIKYKKYTLHLIGITLMFYSHSIINNYLINIMENVGGSSSDMGIALSIAATLELPVMAAFILLCKKFQCSTLLKVSAFFFVIKSAVTWIAPNVGWILFSQSFQMLAFALFTPASIYYVNKIVEPRDRVKGQAMLGVANLSLVGAIAGITGGKILDILGVSDMLLIGTIVSGIGFLIICITTENKEIY